MIAEDDFDMLVLQAATDLARLDEWIAFLTIENETAVAAACELLRAEYLVVVTDRFKIELTP